MNTEINTIEQLNLVTFHFFRTAVDIMTNSFNRLPKSELDKVPIISMTQEQQNVIASYCIIMMDSNYQTYYCCGGQMFKINVTN